MKKLIALLTLIAAMRATAVVTLIDVTTLHTNYVTDSGKIWMTGLATNKDYTVVKSNLVTRGDSTSNSWVKANANFAGLDGTDFTNAMWVSNNVPILNEPRVVLATNLYPSKTNLFGQFPGIYSWTLNQSTNYDRLVVWYEVASFSGSNVNAAHSFDFGTNYWVRTYGSLPTNTVWVTLAAETNNAIFNTGQPAWLTVNGTLVYSNRTTSPALIGLYTNSSPSTLGQTTNFSPVSLYGSFSGSNYWSVPNGFTTTDDIYLALVAATNSPAPGGFTTLSVTAQSHEELSGTTNYFLGRTFVVERIIANDIPGFSGGSGTNSGITNFVFTATNLPAGSQPTVTNTGIVGGIAYYSIGIPAGPPGTNTVTNTITAYNYSNTVLGSMRYVQYSTNYAYWNRVANGSNYLGRFQGMCDWQAYGGNDGGNPPGDIGVTLYGSYSGSNSWFAITNGKFFTTNWISLAIKTNGTSYSGGTILNPGTATIYNLDHPELYGRTNWLDYQYFKMQTQPTEANDLVNKAYADLLFNNAFNGNFSRFDSNGISYFVYSYQNRIVFSISSSTTWIPLKGSSLDGGMTHILVDVYQTNLTAGYDFQSSTNLALTAGFTTFTNYTLSTNTGVVTFTVPIVTTEPARFFRIVSSIASGAAYNVPLALNGGSIYPSNTWSLATITNALAGYGAGKHFWTGSSNGQALVTLSYSNGVVRYIRADY